MLATASVANAATVEYTGLAFNAVDQFFLFTRIFDDSWSPSSGMADPVLGNLGQVNYSVTYAGDDPINSANLNGAHIVFTAATAGAPSITFNNGHSMEIVGGDFYVKTSDNSSGPTVNLPFDLGTADADWELARGPNGGAKDFGYLDVVWNGEVSMRLYICESFNENGDVCGATGNDRPRGTDEPYNTLSVGNDHSDIVGNGTGETDLAMFVLMSGSCVALEGFELGSSNCPFYSQWTEQVVDYYKQTFYIYACVDWSHSQNKCKDYDWRKIENVHSQTQCSSSTNHTATYDNHTATYQVYETTSTSHNKKGCKSESTVKKNVVKTDTTIVMKAAFWGSDGSEVPEPTTLSLFGLGLVGLGAAVRRRRKAA